MTEIKKKTPWAAKNFGQKVWRVISGFEIAIICLSLLMLLTFFGTIEQKTYGLFLTSKKYFDMGAFFLFPEWPLADGKTLRIPIPLPGTYWVSVVLFINMFCGGIIRARKGWKTIGVLISHFGILFMLAAGFVSSLEKEEGVMMVYEGERSDYARSYHEPTIEVFEYEGGERGEPFVVPSSALKRVEKKGEVTASFPQFPFKMVIRHYLPAAEMVLAGPESQPDSVEQPLVDGFFLRPVVRQPEEEMNLQGAYASIVDEDGKEIRRLVLWVGNTAAVSFSVDGKRYGALMPRKIWPMPFEVYLHKSIGDYWPGTGKARWFQSDITKVADGHKEDYTIVMNKPMRHGGYTLFQARWDKPADRAFSGFAIVSNPSDQWPKWSIYVVAFGLLVHFGTKLTRYLLNTTPSRKKK